MVTFLRLVLCSCLVASIISLPTAVEHDGPQYFVEYKSEDGALLNTFSIEALNHASDALFSTESLQTVRFRLVKDCKIPMDAFVGAPQLPVCLVGELDSECDVAKLLAQVEQPMLHSLLLFSNKSNLSFPDSNGLSSELPIFFADSHQNATFLQLLRSNDSDVSITGLITDKYNNLLRNIANTPLLQMDNERAGRYPHPGDRNSDSIVPLLQMGLIIITGIFTISFILSVFLHFSVSHRRRAATRQANQGQGNDAVIIGTGTIALSNLSTAPVTLPAVDVLDKKVVDDFIVELYDKETFPYSNEMCPICIEEYHGSEQVKLLPCGHLYHPACIEPWLTQKSTSCPLCKLDIKELLASTNLASELKAEAFEFPQNPDSFTNPQVALAGLNTVVSQSNHPQPNTPVDSSSYRPYNDSKV